MDDSARSYKRFDSSKPAKWFRMYAEFATDPKVQMLTEVLQRRYIMLLCIRCSNGDETLQDDAIAWYMHIEVDDWQDSKQSLFQEGLIDADSKPTAWDKRQFSSDLSTERVKAYRDKKKRGGNGNTDKVKRPRNVSETAPETETETEYRGIEEKTNTVATQQIVPVTVWLEFVEMRKKIRKPLTGKATDLVLAKLERLKEQGNDPVEVLEQSIVNCWAGVFEIRRENGHGAKKLTGNALTEHNLKAAGFQRPIN